MALIHPTFPPLLLNAVERVFWVMEGAVQGSHRVIADLQLEGCIEPATLATALEHLQYRHPKLRARIVSDDDGALHFRFDSASPPIPFELIDSDNEELPWRDEAGRLMQQAFPESGPLVRVTVLRDRSRVRSELLLAVHHSVADGLSAILLLHELLTDYARIECAAEQPRDPRPPVATTRAKPLRWLSQLWLVRRIVRKTNTERRLPLTDLPTAADVVHSSQWARWMFSRAETVAMVRACRKEQVSISDVLVAAVFCGLMECLPVDKAVFNCSFPFDMRDALESSSGPPTPDDLGCFASLAAEIYQVYKGASLWDVARRAQHNQREFVKHGGPSFHFKIAQMMHSKLFWRAVPKVLPPSKRTTLLATYYGVPSISETYGSLRPNGCILTLTNIKAGPSLVVEGLVMGQRLNVSLAGGDLEPDFWEKLQRSVHKHLMLAAQARSTTASE